MKYTSSQTWHCTFLTIETAIANNGQTGSLCADKGALAQGRGGDYKGGGFPQTNDRYCAGPQFRPLHKCERTPPPLCASTSQVRKVTVRPGPGA